MLSIKEINNVASSTYPQTQSVKGVIPDAQPVFDQAKAYVSLVEIFKPALEYYAHTAVYDRPTDTARSDINVFIDIEVDRGQVAREALKSFIKE